MKNILTIAICTILATAGITAVDAIAKGPTDSPQQSNQQATESTPTTPQAGRRKFRMKLTLSEPGDLRIREGDKISAGQVIADRLKDRTRLEAQRAQVELSLKQLDAPIIEPVPLKPVPPLATLPEPLYLPQWAAIDYERLKVAEAEEVKVGQLRKVEALKAIDGLPPEIFDHEQEKTRDAEAAYSLQVSQLKKSEAELERAKNEQKQAEYKFRLEEGTRAVAIQTHELERSNQLQRQREAVADRAYKKATLQQQLITIDNQIAQLSSVKSPYSAKVQRVKFSEQNDQNLIVDIVLAIGADDDLRSVGDHRAFPSRANQNPGATGTGNRDTSAAANGAKPTKTHYQAND
jgi:hypothetical protein